MRPAHILSLAGAATSAVRAASIAVSQEITTTIAVPVWEGNSTVTWTSNGACDESSYTGPDVETSTLSTIVLFPNTTTILTSTTVPPTPPNATTSRPAEATGGALPQQMQKSMVGLLGFCIMSLIMF